MAHKHIKKDQVQGLITNELIPAELITAGDELQDMLDEREMTQAELARKINKPRSYINEIIKNKYKITSEMSMTIGLALGIEPDYLLRAQHNYDITELRLRYKELQQAAEADRLKISTEESVPLKATSTQESFEAIKEQSKP